MTRLIIVAALAASLSACGAHLKDSGPDGIFGNPDGPFVQRLK